MPVKGTCLLNDTPLKEALFDVIELTAYERLKNKKNASVESIYSDLRKAGVEVDLPTVGEIYKQVTPRNDATFDSDIDVDDYVLKTWNDAINNLIPATEDQEGLAITGNEEIGKQKPEAQVVEFILNALYTDVAEDQRTKSDMKVLQDALWKGMQRKLGKLSDKKPSEKSMQELIDESLGWEEIGITDLNGRLNSISDLFNSMRNELAKASADVRAGADEAVVDRFNEYVRNLENATYNLLFSKKDAMQVRNEALKNAGFGKQVGNRTVLDWNKLAAYTGSVADLRASAEKAFLDAGYPQDVVERLKDTLEQEFYDLRSDIVEKQTSGKDKFAREGKALVLEDAGLNQLLAGKTMAEWIAGQNIETLEQLGEKVNQALAATKYIPAIKKKISDKLQQFFSDNYAKVNEQEAQKAIKDILGDKTVVQWVKDNGIQNQDELYAALDTALSGRNISPQNDTLIRSEFNRILDIDQKAERELRNRENQKQKEYSSKKSDIKRLVELYHLGVFKSSHDKLLYDILGVESIQQKDIADLEMLTAAASDLSRRVADVNGYNLTSDQFVSRRLQYIQRAIDSIIERNIANKSKLLSILKAVANYFDLMLTGLLALPITMVQNIFSGAKSVLTGVRFNTTNEKIIEKDGQFYLKTPFGTTGPFATKAAAAENIIGLGGKTTQSLKLFWSMLQEASLTGQAYGEEIGSFATKELFSNTLRWKWGEGLLGKGTTLKDKAKSILFAFTLPSRVGLLAFDSANKVSLTNKTFYNMIYHSLVARGMEKSQAAQYMNEVLYGQSFKDAKTLAKKVIEDNNKLLKPEFRSRVSEAEITNLANDIVKANLNVQGGIVGTNVLEASLKGSYHVAGLGLGHEPNNILSRGIKTLRDNLKRDEQKLTNAKDWNGLAVHKVKSMLINNFIIRFTGGATNWLVLRAKEGLGLGLVTGGIGVALNKDIDYANITTLQKQMREREKARNDVARAFVGMAYTALSYAIGYAVVGGGDDDDEEKKLKALEAKKTKTDKDKENIEKLKLQTSIYRRIKQNSQQDRWFRMFAPDMMLINYYGDTSQGDLVSGLLNYTDRVYYGNDKFTVTQKVKDAISQYRQGDKQGAQGTLMSIVGDRFQVPFWRASKEYYRVVTNPFRGDKIPPSKYEPATTWDEGLFGGGTLQDLGFYNKDARITLVPGVGAKSFDKFKEIGIETMDDTKAGWWNKKYKNEYILPSDARKKAEKFWNEYQKTK